MKKRTWSFTILIVIIVIVVFGNMYYSSLPRVEYNGDLIVYPSAFPVLAKTQPRSVRYYLYRVSIVENGNHQEISVIRKLTKFGGNMFGRTLVEVDFPDWNVTSIGGNGEGTTIYLPEMNSASQPYSILVRKIYWNEGKQDLVVEGLWHEVRKVGPDDKFDSLDIPPLSELKPLSAEQSESIDKFRVKMASQVDPDVIIEW